MSHHGSSDSQHIPRKENMFRQLAILLITVIILTSLHGCGSGDSDTTNSAQSNQVVRYAAFGAKIRSLDPMLIQDTMSSAIASQLYDCLYQYHYLKRPYQLIPSIASDMPQISEDRLVYTIKLRDDVTFIDDKCFLNGKGRNVTAKDFIYSWMRIANVKNTSGNWSFLDGKIKGLNEFRKYTKTVEKKDVDYDRPIEGLKALDDHTLQITLVKPWPQIMYILAHLPTAVVSREAVECYDDEFINHPVGTGAFILKTWKRGSKLVLVRNPYFRDEQYPAQGQSGDREKGLLDDAGKRLPLIDRIEVAFIQEDQPYWLTFMRGEIDSGGIPKDSYAQAIKSGRELTDEMKKKGIILQVQDDPTTYWIAFNMTDSVVANNLPLRRAMSMAIDRDDYIDLFLNGRGRPARGPVPPGFDGYNPDLVSLYTVYDVNKAKQLVDEAIQLHGGPIPALTLCMGSTDSTGRQMGQYMARAWEKIGITVNVEYMDWPTLQQKVDNKSAQMFQMGWQGDYPDAENFLFLYHSCNKSPGPNSTNYDNPDFDKLFDKVAVMEESPQRTQLYMQLGQMIVDDVPNIYLIHRTGFTLQHPWLKNYKRHSWGYGLFKYQNVDMDMRKKIVGR